MIPKYTIEYSTNSGKPAQENRHNTDDPVACEEFVQELLERGFSIRRIKHEGVDLPQVEFDRIVKAAAGMLASQRICKSLHLKPEEEKFRFGFAS